MVSRQGTAVSLIAAALSGSVLARLAVSGPSVAIALGCGTLALGIALRFPGIPAHLFLRVLVALLMGYALLGRGFAYLGVPPVYLGELVLFLGAIATLCTPALRHVPRLAVTWALLAFCGWGLVRTLPYVSFHGIVALRDAVLWGYAGIGMALAACLSYTQSLSLVPRLYERLVPVLLLWLPVAFAVEVAAPERIPKVPGTPVPIFELELGNSAVHLASIAAFFLLTPGGRLELPGRRWLLWVLWIAAALLAGSANRGGLLAILIAISLVTLLRGQEIPWKAVAWAGAAVVLAFNWLGELDLRHLGVARSISPQQLVANLQSVTGSAPRDHLSSTREWRLNWWRDIADYTLGGEFFWGGKGFGVNLAEDDGYVVGDATRSALRSPHNGHMTVLARMGVPGFLLWVLLQGLFGLELLRAYRRATSRGWDEWTRLNLWILSSWAAGLTNIAFSTALESPQAGIWFWCIFGFGLAVLKAQERERRAADGSRTGVQARATAKREAPAAALGLELRPGSGSVTIP